MPFLEESYDIAVVGAGHAGCEAALAAARLGFETIMFTVSVDSIALMPCNPNIGGSSKGHLVRELDALGGEMGKNIDKTFIQSKMLNESKGPEVHSLRAQADKQDYTSEMRRVLENTDHLTIRQAEISEILTEPAEEGGEKKRITGVKALSGAVYHCRAVVLATGVYDKRNISVIPTGGKKLKVWSNNPKDSYTIVKDANGNESLQITDPVKFWSRSPYLIIQIDK